MGETSLYSLATGRDPRGFLDHDFRASLPSRDHPTIRDDFDAARRRSYTERCAYAAAGAFKVQQRPISHKRTPAADSLHPRLSLETRVGPRAPNSDTIRVLAARSDERESVPRVP